MLLAIPAPLQSAHIFRVGLRSFNLHIRYPLRCSPIPHLANQSGVDKTQREVRSSHLLTLSATESVGFLAQIRSKIRADAHSRYDGLLAQPQSRQLLQAVRGLRSMVKQQNKLKSQLP